MREKPTLLFAIAHPDDEAFGPAGALKLLSQDYRIIILCATKGEAGQNHLKSKGASLKDVRVRELKNSASVLGVEKVHFLNFADGELCNNIYHQLARKIEKYVKQYEAKLLMTWEPRGITGHIDHIVVSLVCHYVFERSTIIQKLMLYCLSDHQRKEFMGKYFIYRPEGYAPHEIDEVYDVSRVWNDKIRAMLCHKSQIKDMQKVLNRPKVQLMEDCFKVITK